MSAADTESPGCDENRKKNFKNSPNSHGNRYQRMWWKSVVNERPKAYSQLGINLVLR